MRKVFVLITTIAISAILTSCKSKENNNVILHEDNFKKETANIELERLDSIEDDLESKAESEKRNELTVEVDTENEDDTTTKETLADLDDYNTGYENKTTYDVYRDLSPELTVADSDNKSNYLKIEESVIKNSSVVTLIGNLAKDNNFAEFKLCDTITTNESINETVYIVKLDYDYYEIHYLEDKGAYAKHDDLGFYAPIYNENIDDIGCIDIEDGSSDVITKGNISK